MNLQPDIEGQGSGTSIGKVLGNVGGNIFNRTLGRLFGNGLNKGAEASAKLRGSAQWTVRSGKQDFRVKVVLPTDSQLQSIFFESGRDINDGGVLRNNVLAPLASTGGVTFPITPSIIINHSASYNALNLTHSNYPAYAYSHSEVPSFTVVGEFPVQNQEDARYWIAMLHFFRSVTKMFFGGEDDGLKGNPPPILSLSGYGTYVFNKVPVLVTNFTIDLRADVDYICTVQGSQQKSQSFVGPELLLTDKNTSWAPTMSQVTLQLQPIYSRESVKNFSMKKFINGDLTDQNGIGYI